MRTMQTVRRARLILLLQYKKKSLAMLVFSVCILWGAAAKADEETGYLDSFLADWTVNGYLKNETAYRFSEPRSITKIRNILSLDGQYSASSNKSVTISGWAYYDLAYDLFDYETISARFVRDQDQPLVFVDNLEQEKDSPVAEIREMYLDIFTDNMDIRLGKQFVVWGVLEGMRLTDEINPMDFRELILLDLLDYRIPLWTAKVDYYQDESTWQFLWIPDLKLHKPAPAGSEWELLQTVPNTKKPESSVLRNSEVGIRYTKEVLGAEIALSYFYTWDDFPVVFRTSKIASTEEPTFFPTFTRMNMYGLTFVKPVGGNIVKGEFVYVPDKYFGLENDTDIDGDGFLDSDGILQKKHIRWGVGFDVNMWGMDISPAIAQWYIIDYDTVLFQDEFDTSLALYIRKPMPEKSAVFQLLYINLLNAKESYIKPKIIFDVTDHFQIATGMDIFYGSSSKLGVEAQGGRVFGANADTSVQSAQFFGNFNNNSRLFMEFKYTF